MNCPVCGGSLESEGQECPKCSAASKIKEVPAEIQKFNFGAFALTLPWALAHRVWIVAVLSVAMLGLISVNIAFYIITVFVFKVYVGIDANKFAWKSGSFESVEKFMKRQRAWAIGGDIVVLIWILLIIVVSIPSFYRARDNARYSSCMDTLHAIKVAEEMYFMDHKKYTDNENLLAKYMSADCEDPLGLAAGCVTPDGKNIVRARIKNSCRAGGLKATKEHFIIKAVMKDKNSCHICVGMSGYRPTSYRECRRNYSESFHPDCKPGL